MVLLIITVNASRVQIRGNIQFKNIMRLFLFKRKIPDFFAIELISCSVYRIGGYRNMINGEKKGSALFF